MVEHSNDHKLRHTWLLKHKFGLMGNSLMLRHESSYEVRTLGYIYPPASKASGEVVNLTERKILIPPYMVSKTLPVSLSETEVKF